MLNDDALIRADLSRARAWVEIDLEALAYNVRQVKQLLAPTTQLMAIVKADAYGHGAVTVSRAVLQEGATWLGVATVVEGIELRQAGIRAPILILGAMQTPEQVWAIKQWQLQPTLSSVEQALTYSKTLAMMENAEVLPVHLSIDTGMSRLGVPWQQATEFVQMVHDLPYLRIASLYSHFATADETDSRVMDQQHARFQAVMAQLIAIGMRPPHLHIANSAATLLDANMHYDLVRVGLALYGLYPAPHLCSTIDLKPVLQVKARVTQVKTIAAGTGVSYGYRYIAPKEIRLAVVSIGYADGVPRSLSNQMMVLIRGQHLPQIGAITMDQLMIDATSLPDLEVGEVVTLLGQEQQAQIEVDEWANRLNTISWEILCGFKQRLPRLTNLHTPANSTVH